MSERVEMDGGRIVLYRGDALAVLPLLASESVDAVVTDPPYPCIKRSYGCWTEEEWFALMDPVVTECQRVLKSTGSAVFILQPNSEYIGRMRTWLWDFLAKWGRKWGVVQDAYWWNTAAMPAAGATKDGLMRGSIKPCVWLGQPDCYRNQDAVLWAESDDNRRDRTIRRFKSRKEYVSGHSKSISISDAAVARGGTTPFNCLPIGSDARWSGGTDGHGASTPMELFRWWIRYLCPRNGLVLDPFGGSGTGILAAIKERRCAVQIERVPAYHAIALRRVTEATSDGPLFAQRSLPLEAP